MILVQVFIPLAEGDQPGARKEDLAALEKLLVQRFGGVTAFVHQPAIGIWQDSPGKTVLDKVVIFEVMTEDLNHQWWLELKAKLEDQLSQKEILVRSWPIKKF